MNRALVVLPLLLIVTSRTALAQCPDGTPPPCRGAHRAGPPAMSVAVLSFANLSRDTNDVYLTEGMGEELTSRLGQVSRLTVASRTAVRRLRNAAEMPTAEIGRSLNVNYILNGSVRRSGSRLRVTVELLRAASGAQIWSSQYDRSAEDLLAIQEDVATAVATAVAGRLLPAERTTLAARPTRSAEAYDAYLRARLLFVQGLPARQSEAVVLLERATTLDSTFAVAWATLSRVHSQMYWFYVDRSAERLARARAAAERAMALAPDAPDTHIAMGYLYYWGIRDYGRALQEFSAALVAKPNDPDVHAALANVARRQGSWEQSVASRVRGIDLDPDNRAQVMEAGLTLHAMRRFDEAAAYYDRAVAPPGSELYAAAFAVALALERDGTIDRARNHLPYLAANAEDLAEKTFHDPAIMLLIWRLAGPHQDAILVATPGRTPEARSLHYLVVGQVLAVQGRPEAVAAWDSVRVIVSDLLSRRPDDDGFHSQLSIAYAGLGRCDDAIREGERAVALLPVAADALTGPQRLQALAEVEAGCGLADRAVEHLVYLLSIPSFVTRPMLRADPAWARLRENARFEQLTHER